MTLLERAGGDVVFRNRLAALGHIAHVPGSKSLTNRALACAALADGRSTLGGVSLSDDADRMIAALRRLGVQIEHLAHDGATSRASANRPAASSPALDEADTLRVSGARPVWPVSEAHLDAGHAGTAMRFLTALACLGQGRYQLDGSPRMRQRPLGELVDALRAVGARIDYVGESGFPPLVIEAAGLTGGTVRFERPPSSQFISALLLAAPHALNDVLVSVGGPVVSRPYIDMTLAVMRAFGVETLAGDGDRWIVPAPQRYVATDYAVEPDASAATYFWAAAAIAGGRVTVAGVRRESSQGDARFVDVLAQMGCVVDETSAGLAISRDQDRPLNGVNVDLNEMPDTVQTLAVAALFARGATTIRNVANLRIKETDRLTALATELRKFGAHVDVAPDGLTITPPATPAPAAVETYDDHRMAMCFALAGALLPGTVIREADCVSKSFPHYFEELARLSAAP